MIKGKKWMALLLVWALVITMLPVVPGSVTAKAENATMLYIKDAPGADTQVITESRTVSENGWSWNADTATLTLNGFDGEYIETDGAIQIVLVGENQITLPQNPSGDAVGINAGGKLTLTGDGEGERDLLSVSQTAFQNYNYVYGVKTRGVIDIENCDLSISLAGETSTIDSRSNYRCGLWINGGEVCVKGDANLDIDIAAAGITKGIDDKLYAQTSGSIDIRLYDSNETDEWKPSTCDGVYGINASGSGTVTIDAKDGNAISDTLVLDKNCGEVILKGNVKLGNDETSLSRTDFYWIPGNKKIMQTESGKETQPCGFVMIADDGVYLVDAEGEKVSQAAIRTVDSNPLTFMDSSFLDLGGLKVGQSHSRIYLHGLVSGGSGSYTYSVSDGYELPEYMKIGTKDNYIGYLSFTSTKKEYPAGTVRILVTDSKGATAYVDFDYGAVVTPPKNITVDGTTFKEDTAQSGTGWSYDPATKQITLNEYNGGVIHSEIDVKLVLKGENILTLPATPDGDVFGIKSDGAIFMQGDDIGERDSLCIVQSGFTKAVYAYGISAQKGVEVKDCDLTVSLAGATSEIDSASTYRCGLWGSSGTVCIKGDANLDIDIAAAYITKGVNDVLDAQTTGNIDIRLYDSNETDAWKPSTCDGVYGINASGSGAVTIDAKDGNAISNKLVLDENCGEIILKGNVKLGNDETSLSRTDFYWIPGNKKIKQTESGKETQPCGFVMIADDGVYLVDAEGEKVSQAAIRTVDSNPLTFMDSSFLDLGGLKVGQSHSRIYFHGLVSGGSGSYTYSVADGYELPEYMNIETKENYIGYLTCSKTTKEYPAGTVRLLVTDSLNEKAYIDIQYGAVVVANPVTSITLDKEELILNIDDKEKLSAVLTPENPTISDVAWNSSQSRIVEVDYQGNLLAKNPGVAVVTATTRQGGLKDTCTVYVKEKKPVATAGEKNIENLEADASYIVAGNEMTSDAHGKIEINDTWRETTIDIIKINAEPKCNSDAQQLYIPAKTAVNIAGVSALATLEYSETPYDGSEKTPTVSIEGLVQDVDYTVSYEDNVNAGNATVIISGKGDYYGSFSKVFKILPIELTGITANAYSGSYDKMGHTFTLSGVPVGAVVTYSLEQEGVYSGEKPTRVEVGETMVFFKVSLTNYEDFYGSTKITILPISIEGRTANLSQNSFTYDGMAKTPAVSIRDLVLGTDFTVSYTNNVNAGTAQAVITGKGNYSGSLTKSFTISPASIAGKIVTLSQVSYTYDGTAKTPTVSVAGLKQNVDYTVAYANNVKVGTATVIVTGKGNYTGSVTKTFAIKEKPAPAKNTTLTDTKTGIKYKVTKAGKSGGTVEFKSPKSKKVTKVTIPATVEIEGITYKVTTIAKSAFSGCSKLKTITIGKNVTTIGDKAFYNCKALTKITIPSQVKKIGKSAFYGCKKLKNITIKTTKLKSSTVGKNAFKGTPKNAKVKVPKKSLKAYKKFLYKKGLHKKAKITK